MKKAITGALAAAAVMFTMNACKNEAAAPLFSSIAESETLRQDSNEFDLDYRFEYISDYRDKEVLKKIQMGMTADFFGEDYVKQTPEASAGAYRDIMTSEFRKEVEEFRSDFPEAYPWDWFVKVRSHSDIIGGRVVAYTVETSYYMGGAHGMETVEYSNYDLRTGDRLTLDDIFTPEGKAALTDRIHARILEERGAADWTALMEESCYSSKDDVQPTENFLLSAEHITFMYNPYDIACYARGRTKVKLPLNGLDGFRKEALEK